MQQGLTRLSHWLGSLCRIIAGIALLALLSVTILDVVLRYLSDLTGGAVSLSVSGSVELVSYLLLFSLLAAMAASVEKSQVVVEALTHRMKDALKARLHGFYLLGFMVLGIILCVGLINSGLGAIAHGEVTQDLRISMGPIYLFAAFLSALLSLRSLMHVLLSGVFGQQEESANG
ncbi:TRAP transporter small permease [Chromohalobacter canadensis]|uniref:TRAP transporter small permease n=1 Tax=Chromohalobacter canadensis TaxID=141389 RepID=UPI0021C0162D|nr:TRAP transporter small permease [Chromohalobacter canadensis]MCT8468842.1 TRAP transporter small permease [Chromohalobacter canadensis]MCT8472968.1 TRAP transporter small permease [Chromohalobacter canadensis]MCT8500420.1 TRAP transporter small permease [Chromohalobacter canadensis]